MDKQNPKETFLLVVQKEVKEKGYILKDMQLVRLWTGKSACGKLLKGEISNVPESLQEQCRGVQDSWSYIDLDSLYQHQEWCYIISSYRYNWLTVNVDSKMMKDQINVLSRL